MGEEVGGGVGTRARRKWEAQIPKSGSCDAKKWRFEFCCKLFVFSGPSALIFRTFCPRCGRHRRFFPNTDICLLRLNEDNVALTCAVSIFAHLSEHTTFRVAMFDTRHHHLGIRFQKPKVPHFFWGNRSSNPTMRAITGSRSVCALSLSGDRNYGNLVILAAKGADYRRYSFTYCEVGQRSKSESESLQVNPEVAKLLCVLIGAGSSNPMIVHERGRHLKWVPRLSKLSTWLEVQVRRSLVKLGVPARYCTSQAQVSGLAKQKQRGGKRRQCCIGACSGACVEFRTSSHARKAGLTRDRIS
ncbi:hypothetical protein CC1G_13773 [Coprinopsis cinerea okayama7|uniref:Uncharacterized protein n=1 Tax=Coprinopsis cinerea (strain Okayama-7 / 130 / ATCC MYA-4618 / FGSC 9003) TaxID=240176 RepID=D6RKC0_COPC7|nr:hypothetical protein CC1G_13773 [Coprinopsis cinerea okayama7\|eukprot:XP_002912241.1 hypothetical protein CC1G_13773 [Coprinopsis cinerea okayama7\